MSASMRGTAFSRTAGSRGGAFTSSITRRPLAGAAFSAVALSRLSSTNLRVASCVLDSASRRNCPLVTTRSPGLSPSSTCTSPLSPSMPVLTSRGSKRPPPRWTKASWRSPVSMMASRGARIVLSRARPEKSTAAYMPGLRSRPGFRIRMRAVAVRVIMSRWGWMRMTRPENVLPGKAGVVASAICPSVMKGMSRS